MSRSILLTNHHLKEYAGSELVTWDLAKVFKSKGWTVVVATFQSGPTLSDLFAKENIRVCNVLHEQLPQKEFDLMWGHHFPVIVKCLVDDGVRIRKLILSSLSPIHLLETPPLFANRADLVLANSQENL